VNYRTDIFASDASCPFRCIAFNPVAISNGPQQH
jgi:hypothetical protein